MTLKIEAVIRQLERAKERIEREVAAELLTISQQNVPVDTGDLKGSGHVENGTVIYDADHALIAHEMPSHTGYKFLENSVQEVDVDAIMERVLKNEIG